MKRIIACCLAALLASSAASRPPPPRELPDYVCPVGGERFEQYGHMQNRLDKDSEEILYDKSWLPVRLDIDEFRGFPECPSNGLPMYRTFTPEELKRLPKLLKHPEFRALLKDTPQPLRTHWLATQFGDSAESKLLIIVPAIDLARSAAMRKRALELVIEAFEASPFGVSEEARFGLELSLPGQILFRLIYVHSFRELGQFERALAELKLLPTNQLTGVIPQPILGPEEAEGDFRWQPVLNDREIWDRSQDERLVLQIAKVEQIIVRRNASATPFELLDEDEAARRCELFKPSELSPSNLTFCNQPTVLAKRKLIAEEREEYQRKDQSGENAAKVAEWATECRKAEDQIEVLDKKPMPLSSDDQSLRASFAVTLAACAARRAM